MGPFLNPESLNFAERIAGSLSIKKVREIVTTATQTEGLAGEQLWASLVYSGATLGVEETQAHFVEVARSGVEFLKGFMTRIDVASSMTNDEEALKSLQSLREYTVNIHNERTKLLNSTHVEQARMMYGLTEEQVLGKPPEERTRAELQMTGFLAYRRAEALFVAWGYAAIDDALADMNCKCYRCLGKRLAGQEITEQIAMEKLTAHFGELGMAFAGFAEFVINECRTEISRASEGLAEVHRFSSEETKTAADDFLKRMKLPTGKTE